MPADVILMFICAMALVCFWRALLILFACALIAIVLVGLVTTISLLPHG
jgi:hypothetical protein